MGTVHDILEERGKQAALALDLDRAAVEAASSYLTDEDTSVGYFFPDGRRLPSLTSSYPLTKFGKSEPSA